jgi:hypothetical protein
MERNWVLHGKQQYLYINDERGGILIKAYDEHYIGNKKVELNPWTTLKIGSRD